MKSISVFEMIKIGIGPSSSHTMGPWKAAEMFLNLLKDKKIQLEDVLKVNVFLYGSLAKTGIGHGTDIAVLMGLSGYDYITVDTEKIPSIIAEIKVTNKLKLAGQVEIDFEYKKNIFFEYSTTLDFHPNGMMFQVETKSGEKFEEKYYSVGGGFVATEEINTITENAIVTPYPCHKAKSITDYCKKLNLSVSELIYVNEEAWRSRAEIRSEALNIWHEIKQCMFRGVYKSGILPGGLNVKRRAAEINDRLLKGQKFDNVDDWISAIKSSDKSFTSITKWVSCFALAVNEENASFGRIVTAPTNGAAGVIPAVLMYANCFTENFDDDMVVRFILTAGEIGTIFKKNATISAAMGGCQAEIGVSSAMAAAALTESLKGSPGQVLMGAEIAMEHHLGMTCDPIGGLVQIPCIERNSMGAMKAITASSIALESDPESARVSLDDVIKSMWETAKDMNTKYKETSEGGLATNITVGLAEC
ncbi:L-serine ammonia-lyase [Bacteriovorax sp. PP10]|uniref:L-serine dehydratase n=1 Tax=Bacteriovorax antarcticus TaxID=3088717 RepID=A0ABU5W016_9BACT|nr:L-serine ammonia-lyase [Bacteriovorax sp. PP10]MEA9358172.1 L-serine ammonia-lyase [Bacteriovorax sp. PP10]